MTFLLDSSVLLHHSPGSLLPFVTAREDDEFMVSVISAAELLHTARSLEPTVLQPRAIAYIETLLERFPLFPIDRSTARMHAEIAASHLTVTLPVHDSWLASTCLAHGLTLASTSPRHFHSVTGLSLEIWPA